MSVFGSRKDDPLLQNDPFAPASEEEEPDTDDSSKDEDASPSNDHDSFGVFGPTGESGGAPPFSVKEEGSSRVIVCSKKEVINGRLTALNAAFNDGWRLERIEWRQEEPTENEAAPALAFVLLRPSSR